MHLGSVYGRADLLVRHTEDWRPLPLQVLSRIRREGLRDEVEAPVRQGPPREAGLFAQCTVFEGCYVIMLTSSGIERGIFRGTTAQRATDEGRGVPRVARGSSLNFVQRFGRKTGLVCSHKLYHA